MEEIYRFIEVNNLRDLLNSKNLEKTFRKNKKY